MLICDGWASKLETVTQWLAPLCSICSFYYFRFDPSVVYCSPGTEKCNFNNVIILSSNYPVTERIVFLSCVLSPMVSTSTHFSLTSTPLKLFSLSDFGTLRLLKHIFILGDTLTLLELVHANGYNIVLKLHSADNSLIWYTFFFEILMAF